MPFLDIELTVDDFANSNWHSLIKGVARKDCLKYWSIFRIKADELKDQANERLETVYVILWFVCFFMLKLDSKENPFYPAVVLKSQPESTIYDLSDNHLQFLTEIVSHISDAELRARVADILWIRKRDHKMAEEAIKSYIDSAEILLDPEIWTDAAERLERALQLSDLLGKRSTLFSTVISKIEDILARHHADYPLLLSARLMELLLEYKQGNWSIYVPLAEKAVKKAEAEHRWDKARIFWKIKAGWHKREGNEELRRNSLIEDAETYMKEACDLINSQQPSYIGASRLVYNAIVAYRAIGNTKQRRDELHKLYVEYEEKSGSEMKAAPFILDTTQSVAHVQNMLKGKPLQDAIETLARLCASPNVASLEQQVLKQVKSLPLQYLFAASIRTKSMKVTAERSSLSPNDPSHEAIRAEMFRSAILQQIANVTGIIDPAREQINYEHNIRIHDLLPIIIHSNFVPPRRELIYAKALYAGFIGDFLTASHLLVAQVENSLRYLLQINGVVISNLDHNGIQNEITLDAIFSERRTKLESILQEDTTFDLEGLLNSRFGSNFRNRVAHGLIDDAEYFQSFPVPSIYLWWLTLRLVVLFYPKYASDKDDST